VSHRSTARPAARVGVVALLGMVALLAGCGGNRAADDATHREVRPAPDTLRGIVVITGADPLTRVVLRVDEGDVPLAGAGADTLRSVPGLTVRVTGHREADTGTLRVDSFRVLGLQGEPAADGLLEIEGDDAVLVTPAGDRRRWRPAPAGLRDLAGRRVWIAGPEDAEPSHWGLLEPRSR